MIHPIIPRTLPSLTVALGDNGLKAIITYEGISHSFPIHGRAETTLSNCLLHITSGLAPSRIAAHFIDHEYADSHCPCCKLEGRVLTAQGRRRSSEADRLIAARAHSGGTVQIRRIKTGLSGAQLRAYEEAYFKRESKPKKPDYPEPVKSVRTPIEELI